MKVRGSSAVEQGTHNPKVASSNLAHRNQVPVSSVVEQRLCNPQVLRSNRRQGTNV